MYTLTKEQKISNLREQEAQLLKKKQNIEQQLTGIRSKISKLEGTSSRTESRTTGFFTSEGLNLKI